MKQTDFIEATTVLRHAYWNLTKNIKSPDDREAAKDARDILLDRMVEVIRSADEIRLATRLFFIE